MMCWRAIKTAVKVESYSLLKEEADGVATQVAKLSQRGQAMLRVCQ